MKITKLGHCCLLIEEKGLRILTDPGTFSDGQNKVKNISVVLITHEHQDHLHIDSLKIVLQNNPDAKVITNNTVGKILDREQIKYKLIEHSQSTTIEGVLIEGFGKEHALMHSTIPPIENTGYFISNRFFYPGDAFTDPKKEVEILAVPVAGPWMKLSEAIDYVLNIKPKICFPVHEGILKTPGSAHQIPPKVLGPKGIEFKVLPLETEIDFA
ncbi:MAG: hypothetical protein RJA61_452 [Candidatus Parcubacteria bacterium]|jgi:L-ascorbate metabolism protein UlaG (beta-lactamase superfamily)